MAHPRPGVRPPPGKGQSSMSNTATIADRQVWPRSATTANPVPAAKPRAEREYVELTDVRLGDVLSFLTKGKGARDGVVVRKLDKVAMVQAHGGGLVALTVRNWHHRKPRR